jgi:carbamoyl-phosphate synthase large subunit
VLLDRFLDDAIEVDVDAVCDGEQVLIGGIMEHIEQAGVHSGDSACSLPPYTLSEPCRTACASRWPALALALGVRGLMNAQFAIQDDEVYILEVNPRASRTVPFVSKAIGVPLAKVGARCMAGARWPTRAVEDRRSRPQRYFVKEAVFPFVKFPGVDTVLGPGDEVHRRGHGRRRDLRRGLRQGRGGRRHVAAAPGKAMLSVRERRPQRAGWSRSPAPWSTWASRSTAPTAPPASVREAGMECVGVNKVKEGRPHIVDMIKNGEIAFIVNTTEGAQAIADSAEIRRAALQHKV